MSNPNYRPPQPPPQPRPAETIEHEEIVHIERKKFHVSRRKNVRGAFLKITEECNGHRNSIILPIEGLEDLLDALENCADADPQGPKVLA